MSKTSKSETRAKVTVKGKTISIVSALNKKYDKANLYRREGFPAVCIIDSRRGCGSEIPFFLLFAFPLVIKKILISLSQVPSGGFLLTESL